MDIKHMKHIKHIKHIFGHILKNLDIKDIF